MHTAFRSISEFLGKIFDNSSIHGFPYIARRDLHFVEKLFWLSILSISIACACFAFSGQLTRYEENPTVLSVEVVSISEFSIPSFTVCTMNYTNNDTAEQLARKIFHVEQSSELFTEYVALMKAIAATNYSNLGELKRFEQLPNVSSVNFLEVSREMHESYPPLANYTRVMTELNMCQTSSDYYFYQKPEHIKSKRTVTVDRKEECKSVDVCRTTIAPFNNNTVNYLNRLYINSHDEVMSGDDLGFVELTGTSIQERSIKIDEIKADLNIRNFKPRSRKCKFHNEYSSDYYDIYTVNLCKMDCRINRAKKFCGCIPFFYTVKDDSYKFCNISGLLCLARMKSEEKKDWSKAESCKCMKLCESTILTKLSAKDQNLDFDPMLTIDMVFPKTRIKRGVLFDLDDLIAGLGGSLALFLGLSVLCIIEILYYSIEYCMDIIINCKKS